MRGRKRVGKCERDWVGTLTMTLTGVGAFRFFGFGSIKNNDCLFCLGKRGSLRGWIMDGWMNWVLVLLKVSFLGKKIK